MLTPDYILQLLADDDQFYNQRVGKSNARALVERELYNFNCDPLTPDLKLKLCSDRGIRGLHKTHA